MKIENRGRRGRTRCKREISGEKMKETFEETEGRRFMIDRMPGQTVNMGRLIGSHQIDCYDNLRIDQNAFGRLCILLRNKGVWWMTNM
ncbi:hypothetical protein ACS0TY_010363 [Phlomoides rotata]